MRHVVHSSGRTYGTRRGAPRPAPRHVHETQSVARVCSESVFFFLRLWALSSQLSPDTLSVTAVRTSLDVDDGLEIELLGPRPLVHALVSRVTCAISFTFTLFRLHARTPQKQTRHHRHIE